MTNHTLLWLQWAHSPAEGVWCGQVWFYYLGKIGSAELGWLYQIYYKLLIVVYRAGNVTRVSASYVTLDSNDMC